MNFFDTFRHKVPGAEIWVNNIMRKYGYHPPRCGTTFLLLMHSQGTLPGGIQAVGSSPHKVPTAVISIKISLRFRYIALLLHKSFGQKSIVTIHFPVWSRIEIFRIWSTWIVKTLTQGTLSCSPHTASEDVPAIRSVISPWHKVLEAEILRIREDPWTENLYFSRTLVDWSINASG